MSNSDDTTAGFGIALFLLVLLAASAGLSHCVTERHRLNDCLDYGKTTLEFTVIECKKADTTE